MKFSVNIILLILLVYLTSCNGIKQTSKREFADGFYSQKLNAKKHRVYIHMQDDVLRIYPVKTDKCPWTIDSAGIHSFFNKEMGGSFTEKAAFNKSSLDIDFLTMPLKYRSQSTGVPPQLNTNLNGALYLGFRADRYKMKYVKNPLKKSVREINHYGFSVGFLRVLAAQQ